MGRYIRCHANCNTGSTVYQKIRITARQHGRFFFCIIKLILKIADMVKLKKIDGITDLRDETNREGMRIVIELRKDVNAKTHIDDCL